MNKNINYLKYLLILLICFSSLSYNDSFAKPKKKTQSKKTSAKSTKQPSIPAFSVIKDSLLEDGICYKNVHIKAGRSKHSVHILEVDISKNCLIEVLKANDHVSDLKQLSEIIDDSNSDSSYFGGVNGSFWRAYTNKPIGPTFIDGELLELKQYKDWSSVFFDSLGRAYFDNFDLSCFIELNKQRITVERFNQRRDSNSIVIYNRFAGNQIPFISSNQVDKAINSFNELYADNQDFNDSTEIEYDLETYIAEQMELQRANSIEFPLKKISCVYLEKPAINKKVRCLIKGVDTGSVQMPEAGFILSIGLGHPLNYEQIKANDTIFLHVKSSQLEEKYFSNGLSATPRLVRNGRAANEARKEGSRGKRFINHSLPRSAIGASKDNNMIYLVSVEGNNRTKKVVGATLAQMSNIMAKIGCYNAMNLDGGGSTTMVIDGKNLINNYNPYKSRRISVGLAVKKIKK